MKRVGIVFFPGTNCERDVAWAVEELGAQADMVFHRAGDLPDVDAVVIPGGFAHGDHLRPGAIARFSPVMAAVSDYAAAGGPVIGICNGFQVLCESGLLPGALRKNAGLKFLCMPVTMVVEREGTALTRGVAAGTELTLPINHFEGNFAADPDTIRRLEDEGRVVFRYRDNPNGATNDIAGICNEGGNVIGLMPHPERASDPVLGSADGLPLLRSLIA